MGGPLQDSKMYSYQEHYFVEKRGKLTNALQVKQTSKLKLNLPTGNQDFG